MSGLLSTLMTRLKGLFDTSICLLQWVKCRSDVFLVINHYRHASGIVTLSLECSPLKPLERLLDTQSTLDAA